MNNYSNIQKILHKLILSNDFLLKTTFEIERLFYRKKKNYYINRHCFITGLARSGTTTILNFLHKTESFASLTYRDMPFVMSPNFYNSFSSIKNGVYFKRPHNDRIIHTTDSPEALDEVFFKLFEKDIDIENNLKIYINLICKKYDKQNYLSKNNYNYKRISLLKKTFPNAKFLITFREPIDHASSLLEQHKNFNHLQKKDKFILSYMNFLGHHEFGLNHKSWFKPKKYHNTLEINYWLEQWKFFYENLLINIKDNKNIFFIFYDDFCKNLNNQEKILDSFGLSSDEKNFFDFKKRKINESYDNLLMCECQALKEKLVTIYNRQFN